MYLLTNSKLIRPIPLLFLVAGLFYVSVAHAFEERTIRIGKHELHVQLAKEQVDLMRGLMFRKAMAPYDGMIFDFTFEQPVRMWMKNTIMPLDMLFFDERRKLVYIHPNATPYSETTISSIQPARYVLELESGSAQNLGLNTGDQFEWGE